MNFSDEVLKSVKTGLINSSTLSDKDYRPQLLINDYKKGTKLLNNIIDELLICKEFVFSVAFITSSGLIVLNDALRELEEKKIKGKILTTDYLLFNTPGALRKLLDFKNIEVKIYTKDNFHTKGYIFKKENFSSLIIGSSNLTQEALLKNKEWNIKVTSMENGELLNDTLEEFKNVWNNAEILTEEFITKYEVAYNQNKSYSVEESAFDLYKKTVIVPTKMQIRGLEQLKSLRLKGESKGIVISATGTGKTYLSAFDVLSLNPDRMLFVVHRGKIARDAMKSFKNVIKDKSMGLLSGDKKDYSSDYIFTTIQTLQRDIVLKKFKTDDFDYIIVDEVHRSGAKSYLKVLDYFNPKFLLGMTATPERTDGFDIYSLFDNNIAFEIRLHDALEEDLLAPFHYFGVTDIFIEGELLSEDTDFSYLTSDERVDKIIQMVNLYGYSGSKPKGLIFCSRVDEAKKLSEMFNLNGFKTVSIDGKTPETDRDHYAKLLESNDNDKYLDFIFSVDVFNEGIDIRPLNIIIMLRATQSAIIFVQQLGRGLRKYDNKEYLVVLDFIGNYENNYMIPMALFGDKSFNKDRLRKIVAGGSATIPGCTTINFDYISKERIYNAIDNAKFRNLKILKEEFVNLKNKIKRVPMMMDLYEHAFIDPTLFVNHSKSLYSFTKKYFTEEVLSLSQEKIKILEFVSKELISTKRYLDIYILKETYKNNSISVQTVIDHVKKVNEKVLNKKDIENSANVINGLFLQEKQFKNYSIDKMIDCDLEEFSLSPNILEMLSDSVFKKYLIDIVDFGYEYHMDNYFNLDMERDGFVLYEKYSRKDVARILGWEKDVSSTMYGYFLKDNSLPIFVNYKKDKDVSASVQYEDKFISKDLFSWMSKNNRTIKSKEIVEIIEQPITNLRIPLFVKKSNDEGIDFYFIGDLVYISMEETTIENDKHKKLPIVNVQFKIRDQVQSHIYKYLIE